MAPTQTCPQCQAAIDGSNRFCISCGTDVSRLIAQAPTPAGAPAAIALATNGIQHSRVDGGVATGEPYGDAPNSANGSPMTGAGGGDGRQPETAKRVATSAAPVGLSPSEICRRCGAAFGNPTDRFCEQCAAPRNWSNHIVLPPAQTDPHVRVATTPRRVSRKVWVSLWSPESSSFSA